MAQDSAVTDALKAALNELLESRYQADSQYDYLVLYSGGKDSTYLAHVLKAAKGGRVCLFFMDTGFEPDYVLAKARKNATALGCDLYIHRPPAAFHREFYNFLISEPTLRQVNPNPLCVFCQRSFIGHAVAFAESQRIPVVAQGFTWEQVSQGLKDRSPRSIKGLQQLTEMFLEKARRAMTELPRYRDDEVVRSMVDRIFYRSDRVTTVFPFMYLDYDIEAIKSVLVKEYGWENPMEDCPNSEYATAGCELIQLHGVLTKYLGFKVGTIDEIETAHARGVLSEEAYQRNIAHRRDIMHGEITPEVKSLVKRLGIEHLFPAQPG